MSDTQGSTKFEVGKWIVLQKRRSIDVGVVVERPEGMQDIFVDSVVADWIGEGDVAQADANDCTLLPDPPELARLREVNAELLAALEELVEVATLRGDNVLPHPADDPKLWTQRMQEAWENAEAAIAKATAPPAPMTVRGLPAPQSAEGEKP